MASDDLSAPSFTAAPPPARTKSVNARDYMTLDGELFPLGGLEQRELGFVERCLTMFDDPTTEYFAFDNFTRSPSNASFPADGWITPSYWNSPLRRILADLSDRIGIRQGWISPEPRDTLAAEPLLASAG